MGTQVSVLQILTESQSLRMRSVHLIFLLGSVSGLSSSVRDRAEECCSSSDTLGIISDGSTAFYQTDLLGAYIKDGETEDGRNYYKQLYPGNNFLYFLAAESKWII